MEYFPGDDFQSVRESSVVIRLAFVCYAPGTGNPPLPPPGGDVGL